MHPALSESYELHFDICPSVFDWFFELDEFTNWLQKDRLWQLRCVGSPGSGKTELSALVVKHLHEKFQQQNEAVVSIFVQEDVSNSNENGFCEDLLDRIYNQLSRNPHNVHDLADSLYITYKQSRDHGIWGSRHLLRNALLARLSSLEHAFLVLDGIDRCYDSTVLGEELSRLQRHGLKIMTTSRVPCNASIMRVSCDTDAHRDDPFPPYTNLYWWCHKCKDENDIICHSCKEKEHSCRKCGNNYYLVEPYDHVDLSISVDDAVMTSFVCWSLENEHGDLGLNTVNEDKPPLSTLGKLIRKHNGGRYAQQLVETVVEKSERNIGFARLLVELVHDAHSIDEIDASVGGGGDRLPKRMLEYFDAGVGKIQQSPNEAQRDLGLKAITVAATCEDCCFKTFDEVTEELLEKTQIDQSHLQASNVDSIIRATNGFLVQMRGPQRPIAVYNTHFGYYVRDNYNASLFWEHAMMKSHHERKKSRTTEFAGMGKTNTVGAGKLLKMRKHINAVSRLLKHGTKKVNLKDYTGFKLRRRVTGLF